MKFKEHWFALAENFQDKVLIDQLFRELLQHYCEPHRFYHTVVHVEKLLSLSDQYAMQLANKDIIDFSIFYHDIIYKPGRGDNEELSAEKANEALHRMGSGVR